MGNFPSDIKTKQALLWHKTTYANVEALQDFQKNKIIAFWLLIRRAKQNATLSLENERDVHLKKKKDQN